MPAERKELITLDKGQENMIEIRGKCDLLTYFIWRCKGYIHGFMGDHRVIWLISKAALAFTFVLAVFMVFSSVPVLTYPKDAENTASVAQAAEEVKAIPDPPKEVGESADRKPEEQTAEIKEKAESKPKPINDSLVLPADVYTEKGQSAAFKAYHPQAESYLWEIYDAEKESWQKAPKEAVAVSQDEMLREISSLQLISDQDQSVRCQISTVNGPPITYEADLHVLSGEISSIAADEFSVQKGEYVSVMDIPVKVTYQDGTKEEITGLSGLYFLEQETTRDTSTESGNLKETITTIRTACEYEHVEEMGAKNGLLCYRPSEEEAMDIPIAINGVDMTPPKITSLTVDGYEISNVVQTVSVTVVIKAIDEVTPTRQLEYAFLPAGVDIKKAKWMKEASFTAEIDKNGIWTAYVKDESGNIASKEQNLVVIDDQPPEIKLQLDNQSGWCSENQIYVSAEDALPVQYRYICETTGEDSGWIAESSKCIRKNGTWKIQVQDTLGNAAEQTITIENIDTQPPVIRSIQEKMEKELNDEE